MKQYKINKKKEENGLLLGKKRGRVGLFRSSQSPKSGPPLIRLSGEDTAVDGGCEI